MEYPVKVSARILSWPAICSCCNKERDTKVSATHTRVSGRRVIRTTTSSWEVPYCSICREHLEKAKSSKFYKNLMWFGILLLFLTSGSGYFGIISLALIGIGYKVNRNKIKEAESLMKKSCCNVWEAVKYKGYYGTVHSFVFLNEKYANSFTKLNAKKVLAY